MSPPLLPAILAVQFLVALAYYPATRWTGWSRRAMFVVCLVIVMIAPAMIDVEHRAARLVAALWAAWMVSKLLDACYGVRPDEPMGVVEWFLYFINPTWMVHRLRPISPSRRDDVRRLLWRGGSAALLIAASVLAFRIDWARWPFAIEHAVKALLFMGTAIAVTNTWAALWRLLGGRGIDAMGQPLTAPTPADFWRRWNRPAQQLFRAYAFNPAGGARRAAVGMMAAFVASALGHEYIFSVAVGRLQGYQTAFFLIQGIAAAATFRLRPSGWRRVGWTVATLTFVLVTSVLFGWSVNEVVPVYADRD